MSRVTGIHFRYTCILYLQYHSSKHTIDIEVTSMLIEHKQQQNTKTENKKLNPQHTQRMIACLQAIRIFVLPTHIPTMNE